MVSFTVNDMTCNHCVSTVNKAVLSVDPQAEVKIDLGTKQVDIKSNQPASEFAHAIEEAGYTPKA